MLWCELQLCVRKHDALILNGLDSFHDSIKFILIKLTFFSAQVPINIIFFWYNSLYLVLKYI